MTSATHHKKLWSGNPLWTSQNHIQPPVTPCPDSFEAEVIVVGAGAIGALIGHSLAKAGFSITYVDSRRPGCGSSMASTAMLQSDVDLPLSHMIDQIGHDNAARAWQRSLRSLEKLAQITSPICRIHERPSIYLSGNVLSKSELQKEVKLRNDILFPAEFIDEKTLSAGYGIKDHTALLTPKSYTVDPQDFTMAHLNAAVKLGAKIYAPFDVKNIKSDNNFVYLTAKNGQEIRASHAIFSTGYETLKELDSIHKKITSSWAIATKPQPEKLWRDQANIWEASDPYLYIRTTKDGRIVCGGEDEEFENVEKRDRLLNEKSQTLSKKLKELIPQLDATPDFSWAGTFGESETSLPMFGEVPGHKRCFATLCFGGNGMTFSQIAAEFSLLWLQGKKDPDWDIFSFS